MRARHPGGVVLLTVLITLVVVGLLIVDALFSLVETVELGRWEGWLAFGDGYLAAALMAGLSAGAGGLALWFAVRGRGPGATFVPPAVWVIFGVGCLVVGALDVANVELSRGEAVLVGLAPLLSGVVIVRALWGPRRGAAWLIGVGLFLVVLSPVAGAVEIELVTNPQNYTPGAPGEPYPFKHDAWVRLWWVTRFQELSELAAMGLFLLALVQLPEARRERTS